KLFEEGVKSRYIAKMVSSINRKLLAKLFELIVPKEYINRATFVVMGSEGRREQIIKTDQDNALILLDIRDKEKLAPYMEKITKILIELGYPRCPGNMMVSNPFWQDDISGYKRKIDRWLDSLEEASFIEFATFFDSDVVVGDKEVLRELKSYIFQKVNTQNSLYLAYFAKLTFLFETPVGIFSIFKKEIDIKKGGIFPVVQGVRALALKYKVDKDSTINRLKELSNKGVIKKEFAKEIVESFDTLLYLRLMAQLEAIKRGETPSNIINLSALTKIKRDLLKDSLAIVDRFKKFISSEFELEYLR
ncbi:MAG: cyclic nucleotide-binding/CBS domain-containing protein, partial [Epsilonproteobacteria bacterium]|nr:cyclic nucleotide-binding/CBS domain-containing protein [Campylobacterota bacterium]